MVMISFETSGLALYYAIASPRQLPCLQALCLELLKDTEERARDRPSDRKAQERQDDKGSKNTSKNLRVADLISGAERI
jgi:hypothetical protein